MTTLYGILKLLILPPMSLLVLAIVGLVITWRWRRFGSLLSGGAIIALGLLSTPLVGQALIDRLQTSPPLTKDSELPEAGAIIVLGGDLERHAAEYGEETLGPLSLARLRYAVALQRASGLPVLLSGGPFPDSPRPLSEVMAEVLEDDYGLTPRWVEKDSQSTFENAAFSAKILAAAGIDRALVVTHAWHMPRALKSFQATSLDVIPAPTAFSTNPSGWSVSDFFPSVKGLWMSSYALHEVLGLWYYSLRYGL